MNEIQFTQIEKRIDHIKSKLDGIKNDPSLYEHIAIIELDKLKVLISDIRLFGC